ncbi:MAG TPA: DNA polymerase I [Phycisphaerales bacterium]|nr:DNA polymerase I [Phycisphaerales bacterium]
MPTLYIIDAYAQFFRAYHAIRTPMTSPVTKEPTNMTFGFVGMLLKLLRSEGANLAAAPATHLCVALDVGGDHGTFRTQLYPQYKATRKAPPEDLEPQVERCLHILETLHIPVLGAEGFEADDVMATLVAQLRSDAVRIRMISKDKDLKQLLATRDGTPKVELFDVHTDTPFTAESLLADTGLKPEQVIDMLAVMGDTVDNVPGVTGVGDKTAAQLITQYGTLDALLADADNIKGKRGENIRAVRDQLALSRTLVTLRTDVPVTLNLADADIRVIALEKLIPICKELGFNRYQDDIRTILGQSAIMPATSPTERAAQPATAKPARRKPEEVNPLQGGLFDSFASEAATSQPIEAQSGTYHCITSRADLNALITRCHAAPILAIDTETTALSPHDAKLCGVSIAITPGEAYYIPTRSPTPDKHLSTDEVLAALRPLLESPTLPKCGHNLKYDLLIFRAHGVNLTLPPGSFDSMVASYLIDASRSSHGLDALALALLHRTNISITQLIGTGKTQRTFDTVPLDLATQYAAEDADVALQLHNIMAPQIHAMSLTELFTTVELPLIEVLAELEWNGILVDPAELDRQRKRIETQLDIIRRNIDDAARTSIGRTFDPDSPKQLAAALFNKPDDDESGLGIKGAKRTKTGFSTDAEVLETLAADDTLGTPIPSLILEYRQLSKLVSTYLVALKDAIHPRTHRIHSSFHQTVAATGRLASSDPNLQNIPIRTDVGREIRKAFIAAPGNLLVTADYSQIELRLLAHLSNDPALIDAFHHDADIHTAVAAQIHNVPPAAVTREQRNGAKMVNFGIVYGITAFGLARRLKVSTGDAAEIINGYKKRFAGITTFLQECIEQAKANGYVTTILGRRRPIPDIESTNPSRRALAERLAINSVVQGSAADLIKLAMVKIERELHPAAPTATRPFPADANIRMLLQIHDELVFEAPESHAPQLKAFISDRMQTAMTLKVPLKADASAGKNWFETK